MVSQRAIRVGEAMKEELADILRGLKDPRVGFVSVVKVEVSGDLSHATAFVSVYGEGSDKENTLAGLNSALGYIRTQLGKRIRLYHVPELRFELDDSIEHGDKISRLLDELKAREKGSPE